MIQFTEGVKLKLLLKVFSFVFLELLKDFQIIFINGAEISPALAIGSGGLVELFLPFEFEDGIFVHSFVLGFILIFFRV